MFHFKLWYCISGWKFKNFEYLLLSRQAKMQCRSTHTMLSTLLERPNSTPSQNIHISLHPIAGQKVHKQGLNSMCSPIKPLVNLITSNIKPQSVQELREHRYNEGNHVSRRLIPEVSMRACSIACTSLQNYRY